MKKPITILVIDDDPLLLNVIRQAAKLNFSEATFSQVYTTAQAITYIDGLVNKQPTFVILSIESKDALSGFHLLAFLKARSVPFMAPVFMLSASQSEDDILDAYRFGAASCIAKPSSVNQWRHYLALIQRHHLQRIQGFIN